METINWPETGLLASLILGGLFFFYLFLKSYIDQKGKNYADKKDIAEITEKVEEVKSQYAKTLVLINANLSLASKGIETFELEQFKSYIAFHQACSYILNDVSNMDIGALKMKLDMSFSVDKQIDSIKESFYPLRKAKANHDLFNDNEEIEAVADELYQSCIKYSNTLLDLFRVVSFLQKTRDHIKEMNRKIAPRNPPEEIKELADLNEQSRLELIEAKENVVNISMGQHFKTRQFVTPSTRNC